MRHHYQGYGYSRELTWVPYVPQRGPDNAVAIRTDSILSQSHARFSIRFEWKVTIMVIIIIIWMS